MLRRFAYSAFIYGRGLGTALELAQNLSSGMKNTDLRIQRATREMQAIGKELQEHTLDDLPMTLTQAHLERLTPRFRSDQPITAEEGFRSAEEMANRVQDELKGFKFYHVPSDRVSLYENEAPFGKEVDDVFKAAREDIAEAGKCLAFGRNTACVFHLMRAAESAVYQMAGKLRVKRIDKKGQHMSWGQLLPGLKTKIEAIKKQERKDEWLRAHFLLVATNRAYRVDVSHANSELRPKETYTDAQTKTCLDATRSFMQYLAEILTD